MEFKFKALDSIMWKKEAAACGIDNDNDKDGSIVVRNMYPECPPLNFEHMKVVDWEKIDKEVEEKYTVIAKSIANDIIIPDPAPSWVRDNFFMQYVKLKPILKKDSVRCFLRLFSDSVGQGMRWHLTITAHTLISMVSYNALRCAKVVLKGEAPELGGMHANPNCITCYGYFPLHEAAERFSVEMIELLLRHGASANVRTVGRDVIEDLLPLHVAVENTCIHKYLEDNLSPSQNHLDYIYKLIHLLCLPEMKIFLDTIRLLARKTNNLLEELWNYIEDGKLVQFTILLLAAQEQIRGGCSSKINDSSKKDGFDIINKRILRHCLALKWENSSNQMAQKHLEERMTLNYCAGLLVDVIFHAGEPLSAYIQEHSEAPHMEVLQHVSSILKDYGFHPTEEVMDTINLQPYDCKPSDKESCSEGFTDASAVKEMAILHAAEKKSARKKVGTGWDPTYTRRRFFPYWRSLLRTRCLVKVYPVYAKADASSGFDLAQFRRRPVVNGCTATPNHKLQQISPLTGNHQPKRSFSIAAIGAFRLLKVLKHA